MAGPRPGAFPLLVRGDWGAAEPPPALKKKLLCYFQSQKRSGGGECELRTATATGHILVCFAHPEVKQRVLKRQSHKVYLGEKGELKLVVTEPETALAAEEEAFEEKIVPTKALDATSNFQTKDDAEALQKAESFGPNSELQEAAGSAESITEKSTETSPSVVFENIQGCSPKCLRMLLENISGLAVDDDFTVEVIPEINAAVATFIKRIDTEEFVKKCSQNKRVKEFKITARLLELTQSIKAENIPATVSTDYITVYFENVRNGGGPVSDVQLFPEENSAIVTFCDHKDLNTVLEKQHLMEQTAISVHPYYCSLGTALYGEERPAIKMPDPVGVSLDPYVWQFLQRHAKLIQDINQEMAICHCELKWPQTDCAHPEIMLCPSSSLSEQKKSMIKLIKTWKQDASTEFSRIMARYIAIKCKVNSADWEDVKNRLVKDVALIITDISEEMVVIAGKKAAVDSAEKEVRECMEKAMKQSEREKQSIEISVSVIPGKYAVLRNAGLEENIHKEYPCLKILYDDTKKTVQLCGLPAEVYKIKADLLEKVLNMPCTSVAIDPHVFYYLQRVDNKTMSEALFTRKKINTFYELEDDAVLLFGDAPKDLLEAEKQIKTDLGYECINVEDGEVIRKEQWRSLLASLHKKYNSSQETLVIDEPAGKENKVIIAGFSKTVTEVYQILNDFIDRNTHMEKVIPAKSAVVVQFVEQEKTTVYLELKKKCVTVHFDTKTPCISLSGPKAEVPNAVTTFEKILSSLYSKNVLIDKPGAKEFFTERKNSYVFEAKQKFSCLIRLEEEQQQQQQQQKGEKVGDKEKRKLYYKKMLPHGVVVAVYKGNLCNYPVDVVVNTSNEDLKHIGGLAEALLKAAGPELQQECNELVSKNGSLQPGCAVITGAGKLPCKNVIHAVGPRWRKDEAEKCAYLLRRTVKKSLQLAETYNHRSIALPAISGGIFGFPLEECTYLIVSSIKETLEESMGDSSLKEVHLVDIALNNIQAFSKALREVFSDYSSSYRSLHQTSTVHQPRKSKISQNSKNFPLVTTEEGLDIMLKEGSIEDATTDIIVISVAKDLQLDKGPLAKALLSKAGPMLQMDLKEESLGRTRREGSVFKTKGYNLGCSVVLHAVVPAWSQRHASGKVLGSIITKCLEIAEELSSKSITFPAIGTGNLGFPRSVVAKLLFDKVFEFSSKNGVNSLKEVHFLLHPKDTANIQVFSDELEKRCGNTVDVEVQKTSPNKASQGTAFSGTSSAPAQNVHEMTIGSIVFRVAEGDITKEEADVIVNITNQTYSLKTGVSRAILNGAGKAVEDECAQQASQPNKSYITTQAGSLPCKKIIHFVAQDDIKVLVSKVLQECELQQYTSVTFPAIGTGEAGRDPAEVADNMIDAITDFARSNSAPSVKTIKVVIFQPHLLSVFLTSMQKRESPAKKGAKLLLSKLTSFWSSEKRSPKEKSKAVLEEKIDLAVVQICGENKKKVEEAENWLKSAILKEQFKTEITDESIFHFGEAENEELCNLQKKLKIALCLGSTSIQISGVAKDVWIAYSTIQEMIHRVKAAKQEEINAELLQNLIEWKYFEKDSYVPFDSLTNMRLENAFLGKQKDISVIIHEKKYIVNIEARYAVDGQGKRTPIIRVDKSEDQESTVLPATWDDMQNQRLKIVELKPGSREYGDVQERFLNTCQSLKIVKIERVQNPFFWKAYQIKKREMDNKNGNRNNERLLFHGTSKESLTLINTGGFNRSYAGMHAANFGNGTYFAVNASYSASDTYSKPDVNGKKYMYLARVLVGEYSQGTKGSITPAVKNASNSIDLFDSSTDNVSQPSMFIIFNDIQAYPEYLITFTR